MNKEILTVEIVSERLKAVISSEYVWPEMPQGWQLEFIVYPDGEVNMDFLHPVSCAFWSEDNGFLETPYTPNKKPVTRHLLDKCGVPYMTTFGHATVSDKPKESHLKSVPTDSPSAGQTVKCFKYDAWVDTDVFSMVSGDIFTHQGQTYEVTAKPYLQNGKPNIPAKPYDCGPIQIALGKEERMYIHMAMDYTCSPSHEFSDGTMQICDFDGGIYSPRLPVAELNEFCKAHLDRYIAFFEKHEQQLEAGDVIEMPRFW